jgi:hypothetical protein
MELLVSEFFSFYRIHYKGMCLKHSTITGIAKLLSKELKKQATLYQESLKF